MAKMYSSVAKAYTSQSRCKKHLTLGLEVVWVPNGARQVLDGASESVEREDIRNGVGTLIRRS